MIVYVPVFNAYDVNNPSFDLYCFDILTCKSEQIAQQRVLTEIYDALSDGCRSERLENRCDTWEQAQQNGWRIAAFTKTKLTNGDCELLADILVQLSDSDDRHGYLAYAGQIDAIIAKLREGGV